MTATVPTVTAPAADAQHVALVLRMAADRIAEYGLWRGECHPVGDPRDCAITAIARATRTICEGHPAALIPLKDAAFTALATHLQIPAGHDPVGQVINWNDMTKHDNPQAMVCQGLRDTANEVLAQAGEQR